MEKIMANSKTVFLIMLFTAATFLFNPVVSYSQTIDEDEYVLIIDGDDKAKTRLTSIDGFSRSACIAAGNNIRKELHNIKTYCLNKSTGELFKVKKKSE